jgi:beta-barrel assembly-enhancing protease
MRPAVRIVVLAAIAGALGVGLWLASQGRAPDRRNLDALVTVGGDVVRDVLHPALDLTRLSDAEEIALGNAIDVEARRGMTLGTDVATQAYLDAVLSTVAAGRARQSIPYRVALVRSPEVNAFAVAGGHVYVTEGLLRLSASEAELAAVIGHEVSHVDLRHCVERLQLEQAARRVAPEIGALARMGYAVMQLGFSEEQELEADRGGVRLAGRAGYDPWAVAELFRRMAAAHPDRAREPTHDPVVEAAAVIPEAIGRYLATHPPVDQRIEVVRQALLAEPEVWRGVSRYVGRSNFVDRKPMRVEARPAESIVRREDPLR